MMTSGHESGSAGTSQGRICTALRCCWYRWVVASSLLLSHISGCMRCSGSTPRRAETTAFIRIGVSLGHTVSQISSYLDRIHARRPGHARSKTEPALLAVREWEQPYMGCLLHACAAHVPRHTSPSVAHISTPCSQKITLD
jgi:hypothetical protein